MDKVLEDPPQAPAEPRPVPKLSPQLRAVIDADVRSGSAVDRDALHAFFKRCDDDSAGDPLRSATWALSMVRGAICEWLADSLRWQPCWH